VVPAPNATCSARVVSAIAWGSASSAEMTAPASACRATCGALASVKPPIARGEDRPERDVRGALCERGLELREIVGGYADVQAGGNTAHVSSVWIVLADVHTIHSRDQCQIDTIVTEKGHTRVPARRAQGAEQLEYGACTEMFRAQLQGRGARSQNLQRKCEWVEPDAGEPSDVHDGVKAAHAPRIALLQEIALC
jgi:hypothetical protein